MKNYIKEHFKERLGQRTNYNLETLTMDLENHKGDVLRLTKNSEELKWFPHLQREFTKYPNSTIMVYESIGICIVTVGMNLVTMYKL
jgi:hypothetical protein